MGKVWENIKAYMNIEPDPDIAKSENLKAVKLILLAGLLNSILLITMQKMLLGRSRYEDMIGAGIFVFLLAFVFFNKADLGKHVTVAMEIVVMFMLIGIAFVDYYPRVEVSAFLFLILLVILPPMIFERPWKLLVMVLAAGILALLFNQQVLNETIRIQNLIRIISVTFLSGVFTTYFSHSRIRSAHMRKSTQVVAEHDPLTGIFNRAGGISLIRGFIERHESGTFLIIDIDDFKLVNDQYGHQKGDEVLREVAGILQASFKHTDIVMRMGGDEFIIYAVGMVDYAVSSKRLEQLNQKIHSIVLSEKDGHYVTVSIGGAINDGSYPTYEALYKAADQYLYQTKAKGKDGYSLLGTSYK